MNTTVFGAYAEAPRAVAAQQHSKVPAIVLIVSLTALWVGTALNIFAGAVGQ